MTAFHVFLTRLTLWSGKKLVDPSYRFDDVSVVDWAQLLL